jgi:hypothetical protein
LTSLSQKWYDESMYLRGNRWNMTRRTQRPPLWRIFLLLALIGGALYVNQVVVPATPPLFIPTPTLTQSPESFVNLAEENMRAGKMPQAIGKLNQAISSDPNPPTTSTWPASRSSWASTTNHHQRPECLLKTLTTLAHAVLGWAQGFKGNTPTPSSRSRKP